MKMAKTVSAFSAALLCGVLSVLNANAAYQNWRINCEEHMQIKTNWCWAASATMSARHANPDSTRGQYHAVECIHGPTYPNYAATVEQTATAATYVAENAVTYSASNSAPKFEPLVGYLLQDKATIVGFVYSQDGIQTGGHMGVVVRLEAQTDVQQKNIYIFDPWSGVEQCYDFTGMYNGTEEKVIAGEVLNLQLTCYCIY